MRRLQPHIFELVKRHGLNLLKVHEDLSASQRKHSISKVFVLLRPK